MSETTATETATDQDRPDNASEAGRGRRGWRPRRLHFHLSIWTLISIGLVMLFLTLSSMSLTGQVMVLPSWVSTRVLDRLNASVPAGSFTLRHIAFGMMPNGLPKLRLVDLGIRDDTGLELAQLNRLETSVDIGAALLGRFEPTHLQLQGGQMTLRRLADGAFALSFGQDLGTSSGNLATLLDTIDGLFAEGPLAGAGRIEARDLTITLEDARSGRLWQVTDGRMEIVPGEKIIDTTVSFDVFNQTEELATTEFGFRSARDSSQASLTVRFENAAARDIAAQSPALAFLSVFDAPISGALRTTIGENGEIADLAGTMQIGSGALSPTPGAKPAKFDGAKVYIDFDPAAQRIDFQGASVSSELGTAEAEGHVFLTDFRGAWPNGLIGQITLNNARLDPPDMFASPLTIDSGRADLRVKLDPFTIDIGQAVAFRGEHRYDVTGKLSAGPDGWDIAIDGSFPQMEAEEALALWPVEIAADARKWVAGHIYSGDGFDGSLVWRKTPGEILTLSSTYAIKDVVVQPLDTLPPINVELGYVTQEASGFVVFCEKGWIDAPDGSVLDVAGTSYIFRKPEEGQRNTGAIQLAVNGPVRGVLELLAREPFNAFKLSKFGPDLARGTISARGRVAFPLVAPGEVLDARDVTYDVRADLLDVSSDVLVENKLLRGERLTLHATHEGIEISGPVELGQANAAVTWHLPLNGGQPGVARVTGTADITPQSLAEFNLAAVGDMVDGRARARVELDFSDGAAPVLSLSSDLAGLAVSIPGTGWSKPRAATGSLTLEARLGPRPEVERLEMEAPGLSAQGRVTTAEGGGLGEASFDRVRIGGWLDAPVVLTGRGDQPISITVPGGTIDLGKANLASSGGGTLPAGPRMPLILSLDRMVVSEGIAISNLRADLDLAGGMHGTFSGQLVGGAPIKGTMAQQAEGAAFRITSEDAGAVMKGAGVFTSARGGKLELILAPVAEEGSYEGEFTIEDTRLVDAPAMAELLSAVSVVGLLDQMEGEGIRFTEVDGRFRLSPSKVTLYRAAAVGASMGISMDGYYDMDAGQIDMQGVLSPFYLFNSLGRLFSARDGEGLVGFNFTLKGSKNDPEVGVNPLSILTPGVFREIFRRPPPEQPAE